MKMKKSKSPVVEKSSIPQEIDSNYFKPVQVQVFGNGFERAMKTFRQIVQSENILSEYKEKSRYEKPSDKKRRKQSEAIQNAYKEEMKMKKIISGEYEKEKAKKQVRKEQKMRQRSVRTKELGEV
jgi:small subunit ribosomal protein S21